MHGDDEAVWPDFPFSKDVFSPRGEVECLENALEELGCTASEGSEEYVAACEQIDEIAIGFNYARELDKTAPRLKDTLGQMADLREGVETLLKAWSSADQMTAHVLNIGIQDYRADQKPSIEELRQKLMGSDSGEPQWPDTLSVFLDCLGRGEELLIGTQGSGDPDKPDLGGSGTLYTRLHGHPKWHLLVGCRTLFEEYRPGDASGSEIGPLANFSRHVYDYATGDIPGEAQAGLERWIKKVARFFKRRDKILARAE